MYTFVKLMLPLITNVTTSPAWRRRISSATMESACRSRPRVSASVSASSTLTSWSSSARARIARTSEDAPSRTAAKLPAAPVLMRLLHEAVVVDQRRDARAEGLVEELRADGIGGIDRQPFPEREAFGLRRAPQVTDERPRLLGIDVVERERRDAAPVVEARGEQARVRVGREVRRRLHGHGVGQHQARDGDRPQQVVERGLGGIPHRDPRLRAEVLHDDLLDVTVTLVEVADGRERVDSLRRRLADPD